MSTATHHSSPGQPFDVRLAVRRELIALGLCQPKAARADQSRRTLPHTPRLHKTLRDAERLARRMGHDYLGIEHVALALASDGQSYFSTALERLGVTGEQLAAAVGALLIPPAACDARSAERVRHPVAGSLPDRPRSCA